jgi:nucleolar protein 15
LQARTEEERSRVERRLIGRQNQRKRKLAEAGIDYDLDKAGYVRVFFNFAASFF